MEKKVHLFVVRHGESEYNEMNRFCGWIDAQLTPKGIEDCKFASDALKECVSKYGDISKIYTSVLRRSIDSLAEIRKNCPSLQNIDVESSWRLNERHYGALQDLNKSETAKKYGEEQVQIWRRSFDVPPPRLDHDSPMNPVKDPLYKDVDQKLLPLSECLKDTANRVKPFYATHIYNRLLDGQNIVVVAHGNTTRSLLLLTGCVGESEIVNCEIPCSIPLHIEFEIYRDPSGSKKLKTLRHEFLIDDETLRKEQEKVKNQGKAN